VKIREGYSNFRWTSL